MTKVPSIAFCMVLAAGCVAVSAKEVPAVIDAPSSEVHSTLVRAVSELLGQEVTLAENVFNGTDRLIVEPARLRDPQGNLAQGRELRPPVHFRLVKNGQSCIVLREDSGKRKQLDGVRCRALE